MISCKLEDVIIRHKKPRQTGKPMTCFIIEIIAGKNYCSLKRRFFDPVQQSFDVSLIKRRIVGRVLRPTLAAIKSMKGRCHQRGVIRQPEPDFPFPKTWTCMSTG